jgi:hypothetical protein
LTDPELFESLVENAFDFLEHAIGAFPNDLKFSMIDFYAAVELFLKARLCSEHWTQIVKDKPDRAKLETGDFQSVSFEDACERLRKVVGSPLTTEAKDSFDVVRKRRNRTVHFSHVPIAAETPESIGSEQLRAWYHLNKLLTIQWRATFAAHQERVSNMEPLLHRQREYLVIRYNDLLPQINAAKADGIVFRACTFCKFDAAEELDGFCNVVPAKCKVCRWSTSQLEWTCPQCDEVSRLNDGGTYHCVHCGANESEEELLARIDETPPRRHDEMFDDSYPNCSECEGYHTVALTDGHYLCIQCYRITEAVSQCEWCLEINNGDMDGSYLLGCSHCEGNAGHHRDD